MSRKQEIWAFKDVVDAQDKLTQLRGFVKRALIDESISATNKSIFIKLFSEFIIKHSLPRDGEFYYFIEKLKLMPTSGRAFTTVLHKLEFYLATIAKTHTFRLDENEFAYEFKRHITHDQLHRIIHLTTINENMKWGIHNNWHLIILKALLSNKFKTTQIELIQESFYIYIYHLPEQETIDELLKNSICRECDESNNKVVVDFVKIPTQFIELHLDSIRYCINIHVLKTYEELGKKITPLIYINEFKATNYNEGTRIIATFLDREQKQVPTSMQIPVDDQLSLLL